MHPEYPVKVIAATSFQTEIRECLKITGVSEVLNSPPYTLMYIRLFNKLLRELEVSPKINSYVLNLMSESSLVVYVKH